MQTTVNTVVAKFAVAFVAVAMMFTLVAPASAQNFEDMSLEELIALVTQLSADLGQSGDMMSGGSSSDVCPYTWTRTLNVGDTGADVMMLQKFLNSMPETVVAQSGAGSMGNETDYYGPATGAAVANFQMKYRAEILSPLGLVNATTFFGNSTMAQANALCVAAPMMDDDMGDDMDDDMMDDEDDSSDSSSNMSLGNDEGSIDSVSSASADESNLEEGQEGGVLGFDVEIEGDVEINRIDIFAQENGSASDDADDYFENASLWVDGEKIATIDVSDWDQDDYTVIGSDDYRIRFTSLGLVFEDGDEPEFQVAFEALGNIDSTDRNSTWDVEVDSIRYVDGVGFTDSEDNININENFGFEEEEMAELQLSESSDNPDATTLEVDGDDQTDDVAIFVFEIEEENGVDVVVDEIRATFVTLSSTSAAINEDVVLASARLMNGSDELSSENVPSTGIVDFENIDLAIDADETVELTVEVTFEDTNDQAAYGDGTTVQVTAVAVTEADDENGNDEGDMTISGTPTSEVHTLREDGVSIVLDSESTSVIENDDTDSTDDEGRFEIEFTVTAFGEDVYLPFGSSRGATSSGDGVSWELLDENFAVITTGTTSASLSVEDSNARENNSFEVEDGSSETFTLVVEYDPVAAGSYSLRVSAINYAGSDSATATVNQDVSDQDIDTDEELI